MKKNQYNNKFLIKVHQSYLLYNPYHFLEQILYIQNYFKLLIYFLKVISVSLITCLAFSSNSLYLINTSELVLTFTCSCLQLPQLLQYLQENDNCYYNSIRPQIHYNMLYHHITFFYQRIAKRPHALSAGLPIII